jgi:uncharacterized surface protein with fasciclin (FAS1) repeats
VVLGVAVAGGLALTTAGAAPAAYAQAGSRDIVDTAVAAGQFATLARALQAAGLVETLKGPGPFTVFAPTDAAFAKLPAGTLEALLRDPARLRAVLTYHVVPGRVLAADVVRLSTARSAQGASIRITVAGGTVRLNGGPAVLQTDVLAANGVIHVIDAVLLPPPAPGLPRTGRAAAPAPALAVAAPLLLGAGLAVAGRRRPGARRPETDGAAAAPAGVTD